MGKYFGTDGFRGEVNITLTAEKAFQIGRFLGCYYLKYKKSNERPKVVIGKDTRRSSYMLEYSLVAGLTASGADAYLLHVTTTPCVSYITRVDCFDCGIMISASHNPYYDNGIKLINGKGEKADEDITSHIEKYLDGDFNDFDIAYALGEKIGKTIDYISGRNRYIGYLISLGIHSFKGIKIGLDCANGSAWNIAKAVFDALGGETYVINAAPDGININNNCGSTHIEALVSLVKEKKLDVGFAYDGDADRCICVDEKGNIIDGDGILYIYAKHIKKLNADSEFTVVTKVMSNLGLLKALDLLGIKHAETDVGDRFVYEYMSHNLCPLGGEQSGHIIFSKYASTGDGILTSLKMMEVMLSEKESLGKLVQGFLPYPQLLINMRVKSKEKVLSDKDVLSGIKSAETFLGERGRVLVRPSGTEPVIRVMVEAESEALCEKAISMITDIIKNKEY